MMLLFDFSTLRKKNSTARNSLISYTVNVTYALSKYVLHKSIVLLNSSSEPYLNLQAAIITIVSYILQFHFSNLKTFDP